MYDPTLIQPDSAGAGMVPFTSASGGGGYAWRHHGYRGGYDGDGSLLAAAMAPQGQAQTPMGVQSTPQMGSPQMGGGLGINPMQIARSMMQPQASVSVPQMPFHPLQIGQHPGPPGLLGGGQLGRVPGGWSGGMGGYAPSGPENALSAPLQALIATHLRRMLSGQGQGQNAPRANFAAMLAAQARAQPNGPMGQPAQATPMPFGQPAQFGGQGPPGGGMRPLTLNSPGQ